MRFSFLLIALCAVTTSPIVRGQDRGHPAPPAFEVMEKSIEDLQKAMQDKQVTSRQLVDLYLARIEAYDQRGPALNAIVALNPEARAAADALDAERAAKGARGPLHGIAVLVKDNYETIEMPTTAGSIALATFHPARDAFVVRKLKEAGVVILGKTTMHELAAGITTVGSSFGQTRNPYDLDRTPGGSSGGTGAAIAATFAAAGMGSDTCGSIRIPAANNNLVGLRGTQGLSSRSGIVPLSSSQDIGGPIARSVADLAIMLDATIGPDPADPQTARRTEPEEQFGPRRTLRQSLSADALKGARLGVVRSLFGSAAEDQEVTTIVTRSLEALKKAGAEVTDVVIPGLDDLLRDSSLITSDFKFDLMEYLAKSDNPPVHSLGEILDRGLYHSALESTFRLRNAPETRETEATRRARIKQAALRQVTEALIDEQRLDALVYPALRRRPARIGEAQAGTSCQLSAHSGLPALSVPAGFTNDGVPVGVELLGRAFTEAQLLSLGYSMEQTLKLRQPPFSTPALAGGKAPAPRTTTVKGAGGTVTLAYDVTTSQLEYTITADTKQPLQASAIWLQEGTTSKPGAARHRLSGGRAASEVRAHGVVTLTSADRQNLKEGKMLVRFYPRMGSPPAAKAGGGGQATTAQPITAQLPEMSKWQ
jgi:Asp-tRNA(Asn)/Glu-tRNA(Gln) amidotransferase A subunit family amidase